MGRTSRDEVRDAEQGMGGCRGIARERSELEYSWDTDGDGKTEEVGLEIKWSR